MNLIESLVVIVNIKVASSVSFSKDFERDEEALPVRAVFFLALMARVHIPASAFAPSRPVTVIRKGAKSQMSQAFMLDQP
jgi:hypothetical protein